MQQDHVPVLLWPTGENSSTGEAIQIDWHIGSIEIHGAGTHWVKSSKPWGTSEMGGISQGRGVLGGGSAPVRRLNSWGVKVKNRGSGWANSMQL